MSKQKESGFSRLHITIGCILLSLLLIGIIIAAIVSVDSAKYMYTVEYTSSEIAEKVREAIKAYDYGVLILDQSMTSNNEVVMTEEYIISSERTGSKRTYTYFNSNEDILSEWWEEIEDDPGHYDCYIYSQDYETWVNTKMDSEPISNDLWNMFDIMSQYTVLPETAEWYDDHSECYVLQLVGKSDGFYAIYEEIYIRTSDFIPMGIIEYCVATEEDNRIDELDADDFNISSDMVTVEGGTIETQQFSEIIRKYSVNFSTQDQSLFGKPDTFISDEDYMYLEYTYGEDTEETEDIENDELNEEENSDVTE